MILKMALVIKCREVLFSKGLNERVCEGVAGPFAKGRGFTEFTTASILSAHLQAE